ncbi:hypothetical protein C4577_01685 [Candidatus Parcubacteria bacterium]|nr:MAG: hypothetical protein C4577_01685 [Candidatus Parcubacteria bacterium]
MGGKLGYEPTSRELQVSPPTNNRIDFPFTFPFKLPDPRKTRIIFQRDDLGRIIHSKDFK